MPPYILLLPCPFRPDQDAAMLPDRCRSADPTALRTPMSVFPPAAGPAGPVAALTPMGTQGPSENPSAALLTRNQCHRNSNRPEARQPQGRRSRLALCFLSANSSTERGGNGGPSTAPGSQCPPLLVSSGASAGFGRRVSARDRRALPTPADKLRINTTPPPAPRHPVRLAALICSSRVRLPTEQHVVLIHYILGAPNPISELISVSCHSHRHAFPD
ncbi:hypothetical protein PsYK624_086520 [Phanerochaete sordida]|uniref:Uncharacterized protein n=1 Tax=Phanerochaete sordida TaxID=48140 RepID=A0A9P3GCR7_9APHY|nr:hypothetical protein PsYK624_086520 [Phanerochaete sordida]